jgi:hypothetical protein
MTNRTSKEQKAQVVAERLANWNSLSTTQKIADLDLRLGKGQGAVKQRARLAKQLEAEKAAAAPKAEKPAKAKAEKKA